MTPLRSPPSHVRRAPAVPPAWPADFVGEVAVAAAPMVAVRTQVEVPLQGGVRATFITFDGFAPEAQHFALRLGHPDPAATPLVRMHSECITGDVFGSLRCDCGAQLAHAIEAIDGVGGYLLYLRQEGRGIGLAAKMDAYRLQDGGLDTYAANRALALPEDGRDYACGAAMLRALAVPRIRLLSNNPDKQRQLRDFGIDVVERVPTPTFTTAFNRGYLAAKARQTGHSLDV